MLKRLIADRFNIGKLENTPVDLSTPITVVKHDIVKKVCIMNWLKKLMQDVNKKIPDTNKFIETDEFSRLAEIHFNARIAEALKNLATKKQVVNALDLGNKNREKKLLTLDLSYFIGKGYLMMMMGNIII